MRIDILCIFLSDARYFPIYLKKHTLKIKSATILNFRNKKFTDLCLDLFFSDSKCEIIRDGILKISFS